MQRDDSVPISPFDGERYAALRASIRKDAEERAEQRARAAAERRRRARETGEPDALVTFTPGDFGDAQAWFELVDGRSFRTHAGTVEFLNPPGRVYDYIVEVRVPDTNIRTEESPGVISVRVGTASKPYVHSVQIIMREGGEALSERQLQREGIGELRSLAIKHLSRFETGKPVPLAKAAVGQMTRPETKALEVAEEAFKSMPVDAQIHEHVGRALREAGHGEGGARYVTKLLGHLASAGRIDYTPKRGRPSRP